MTLVDNTPATLDEIVMIQRKVAEIEPRDDRSLSIITGVILDLCDQIRTTYLIDPAGETQVSQFLNGRLSGSLDILHLMGFLPFHLTGFAVDPDVRRAPRRGQQ